MLNEKDNCPPESSKGLIDSRFKKLIELSDKACREEMDNIYFVTENRMNNILYSLEDGFKRIKQLTQENYYLKMKLSTTCKELEEALITRDYDDFDEDHLRCVKWVDKIRVILVKAKENQQ